MFLQGSLTMRQKKINIARRGGSLELKIHETGTEN